MGSENVLLTLDKKGSLYGAELVKLYEIMQFNIIKK